jgi:LmbE family N-acetylglucosaminyl deacetylase
MLVRSFLKTQLRHLCWTLIRLGTRELDSGTLRRSAFVFSPHPDDETLACGGTIIKKREAGARVKIVFMTDGRNSHRRFIPGEKLKEIRAREALAAGRVLGVEEQDVIFLDYQDGELSQNEACAVERVMSLICNSKPEEIYMPCSRDRMPDHLSTYRVISSALARHAKPIVVYEYPVWFWLFYPWVSAPALSWRELGRAGQKSFASTIYLLRQFRHSTYIGDVLELKRLALEQHKSQMTPLLPDPGWRTLRGVSNGEFLECFFREREVFYRSTYNAA